MQFGVMDIPKSHPRYESLNARERIVRFMERGLVVKEGLIAHGRGEAFDYLIGEKTLPQAEKAEKAAAAYLLNADSPVISVNGNAAALSSHHLVELSNTVGAKLEANIFYGDREKRIGLIVEELKKNGAVEVLGLDSNERIPGLEGQRGLCSSEGIYSSDVVLVPLEDGDRAECLSRMGKVVISIDLNPMSRTSATAKVSIVDELTRAVPRMTGFADALKGNPNTIGETIEQFDNSENLSSIVELIVKGLGRV
jgi:4-phosphopantoate--beta-alanine ligase